MKLRRSCARARAAAMRGMKRQRFGAARTMPRAWVRRMPVTMPSWLRTPTLPLIAGGEISER
jgi:hypothetical protein